MSPRGEFGWIERLLEILGPAAQVGGRIAAGDDVATIGAPGGETWAWTADTLVEGVHFRFDWLDPEAVGHRALAASLSDLAAAIAEPIGVLVTAAGPRTAFEARLEGIYRGLRELAARVECPVLGGDLSRSEGPLVVTVTALGRCLHGAPPGRAGARPGDEVWVTGALGGPAAAIALLADAEAHPARLAAARAHPSVRRLARPEPRLAEAAWLAERASFHALIDVSDGISGDLSRIADRSGVRIVVDAERLPLHADALDAAARLGADARPWALHGGEEFEIAACAPADSIGPHVTEFESRFRIPLTRIGRVEEGSGIVGREGGTEVPIVPGGWDHFR